MGSCVDAASGRPKCIAVTAAREADATSPVILCYDGSKEAADAIAYAGELLRWRPAIVVTAWKPVIE